MKRILLCTMMPLIIFCSTQNLIGDSSIAVQQKESVAFEESEFFVSDTDGNSILPIDPVTLNISVQSTSEETDDRQTEPVSDVISDTAQTVTETAPEADTKTEETKENTSTNAEEPAQQQPDTAAQPEPEPAPQPQDQEPDNNQPIPGVTYYNIPLSYAQQNYTVQVCERYGVDVKLMYAMMAVETNFKVNSVSAGCYGILQINSCHLSYFKKVLGVTEIKSFENNVLCATYLMSGNLAKYGDVQKALISYNCGGTNAEKLFAKGIYQTSYSKKIVSKMESITVA